MTGAFHELGIAGTAKLIESREVSPLEVTRAILDRADGLNGELNAYISLYPEQALAAAKAAEAAMAGGNYLGPLHGIPLAVKDLFRVNGMRRTCGSRTFQEGPEVADATSVARLKDAGAIILGMLNLHEFAYGPTGINPAFGSARNPWNTDRGCGGSSSGSGCAVAAGMALGALGTDTGGSIRLPAAVCGIVGLKQTFGLASREGIFPLSASYDHGGPLARSVEDAAIMLAAIAGPDPLDPTTRDARPDDYRQRLGNSIAGLRVGVPTNFFFEDLYPGIEDAVRQAIALLGGLGADIIEVDLPFMDDAIAAWTLIATAEAYGVHEQRLENHGEMLAKSVRERLALGKGILANDLLKAKRIETRVAVEMTALLERVDVIATPTSPLPAVDVETGNLEYNGEAYDGPRTLGRLTRLASLTGQPAVAVPCGFTADGMPVSLQLLGGWWGEGQLLQVAHAYEQAAGWQHLWPTAIASAPGDRVQTGNP
jgi:aspartyl-tRNA(Asn)/glutamyl-tRNA(Gln) amidotransferase subunit A